MILWYPGALIYVLDRIDHYVLSSLLSLSFSELIEFLHGVSKERTSLDRRSTIEQEGPESWYIQRPRPDIYSDRALVSISISCLTLVNLKFQHAPVFFFIDLFFLFSMCHFFLSCNLINYGSSFFLQFTQRFDKCLSFSIFYPRQTKYHSLSINVCSWCALD